MEQIITILRDKARVRWAVLLLVSFIMAANYYFFDALSPLQSLLQDKLRITASDYGLIQSFYSFPNTFLLMAIFGGIILDRLGIRITGSLFVGFMLLGGLTMTYAVTPEFSNGGPGYHFFNSFLPQYSPTVKLMCLGQLLFGLGAETSIVVINKIMVKWFKGREIALAFAVNLSIARIGSFLAFQLSPRIAQPEWTTAIWFSMFLLGIALLFFFIYCFYDRKLERQINEGSLLTDEDIFRAKDLFALAKNRSFVIITLLCLCFYAAIFPFLKYAPNFFQNKFALSLTESSSIPSYLPLGAIFFTPIFGYIVDRFGKAAMLMLFGSFALMSCHLIFALTYVNPYAIIFILGISFSLVPAAMWPSVAKLVPEKRLGTAYGTMFSIQNFGMWLFTLMAGRVLDASKIIQANGTNGYDYTNTMLIFAGLGVIAFLLSIWLKWEDKRSGIGLELSSNSKK